MAVYIDDAMIPFGRMRMCHMMADTPAELHSMAATIGMRRSWFQGARRPHYDIPMFRRDKAVALGAVQVTQRQMVVIARRIAASGAFSMEYKAETAPDGNAGRHATKLQPPTAKHLKSHKNL